MSLSWNENKDHPVRPLQIPDGFLSVRIIVLLFLLVLISCKKEEDHPPSCNITSPAYAQRIIQGNDVKIEVQANDEGGSISSVAFWIESTDVFETGTAPYVYTWKTNNATPGTYHIRVIAKDNSGNQAVSETYVFVVSWFEYNIVGKWQDENSIITYNANNSFVGTYPSGTYQGSYTIVDSIETMNFKLFGSYVYRILLMTQDSMVTQYIPGGEIFHAVRIN